MLERAVPSVLEWLQARQTQGLTTTAEQLSAQYKKVADDLKPFIADTVKKIYQNRKITASSTNPAETTPAINSTEPIKEGEVEMKPEEILAETKTRFNNLLAIIIKEMEIRPKEAQWVDLALAHLPEDVLEEIGNAKDEAEITNVLKKYGNLGLLMQLDAKMKMSPKKKQWVLDQFKVLVEEFKASKTEAPVNNNPVAEVKDESPQI
jgi:hypothetical protein